MNAKVDNLYLGTVNIGRADAGKAEKILKKRIYHILLSLFMLAAPGAKAQVATPELPLKIVPVDGREVPFSIRKFEKPVAREDLEFRAGELISEMRASGYATASADRYAVARDTAFINLFIGERYRITGLDVADSNRYIMDEIGLGRNWSKKAFMTPEFLGGIQESILRSMENNGYPYARAVFGNARIDSSSVQLSLAVSKGPLIRFDTLHNVRQAEISRSYLQTYTGIKKGRIYDQSLVEEADERLAEVPFLRVLEPSRLWFSNDNKAHVEMFLEDRKVSKFDFLIGVLPNNAETGKVLVTGEAGISLWSIFGMGEKIDVGWKRLKPKSQQLHIYFDWPYLIGTPLGADVEFNLDKQDTSYLDLDWALGVQYLFRGTDMVKIVIHNTQTFLQTPDTTYIKTTGNLPPILDQSTLLSGLETYFEKLDYIFNPSEGWELGARVTAGVRKIKQNNTILDLSLPADATSTEMLYDSLGARSGKISVSWMAAYYIPLAQRQVVKVGVDGAAVYNKDLLTNELLRIGGNSALRGFDEESIYTSLYNISTIEYRYLLDRNAFLSLFFDWAYVERRQEDGYVNDFPFGFGAGLNFETKAGIFGLSYAVGRQNGNPPDLRSSKIHFGYVNIF